MTAKGRNLLSIIVLDLSASERAWFARKVVASLDGEEPTEEVEAAWTDEFRHRRDRAGRGNAGGLDRDAGPPAEALACLKQLRTPTGGMARDPWGVGVRFRGGSAAIRP
jgi:putative addiction module component